MLDTVTVALVVYGGVGLVVAIAFVGVVGPRLVPGLTQSTWAFRLLILPSCILLWPALVAFWAQRARPSRPVGEP